MSQLNEEQSTFVPAHAPHVDRNQAITQLEALGYKRRDAVYIRASLPKEDPHYGPVPGRKADKLNWEQMRSLTSPEQYTADQLRTRMMQGVKG